MKKFNYMTKLKELHSEHALYPPLRWYLGSSINILLCLLHPTCINPSYFFDAFQCRLQTSVLFTLNTQQHIICQSFSTDLFFFFLKKCMNLKSTILSFDKCMYLYSPNSYQDVKPDFNPESGLVSLPCFFYSRGKSLF